MKLFRLFERKRRNHFPREEITNLSTKGTQIRLGIAFKISLLNIKVIQTEKKRERNKILAAENKPSLIKIEKTTTARSIGFLHSAEMARAHVYRNLILALFFQADDARARCGLRIISRAWNRDGIEIESRGGVDGHVLVSIRPSRTRHAIPHRRPTERPYAERHHDSTTNIYIYIYILTAEEFHTNAHARVYITSCRVSCSVGNYLKASTNRVLRNLESK